MIVDISKYQGKIDWHVVAASNTIERVILRGTVKSGELDQYFLENYDGATRNCRMLDGIDIYKFSYVRTLEDAFNECEKTIKKIKGAGAVFDRLWLDLEKWGGRDYTKKETFDVALGYMAACALYGVDLGIYCNYNYCKNILDHRLKFMPVWLARYNTFMGDISPFKVIMWQYTSSGKVNGISGNVDVSKYV